MKIISLKAENFKRLRAVEITPAGNLVELKGKNGAGKSSVLDAIWAAVGGGDVLPKRPVRDGAERAHVTLDLGELIVTRKFAAAGTTSVTVEATSGARYPSPQRMLDQLIGSIAFDPLAFTRMKPRDQLDELRRLVKLDVDVDALDGLNRRDYEARTEANRDAARLRAQASGIHYPAETPAEPVDLDALTRELQQAAEHNSIVARRNLEQERLADRIAHLARQAEETGASIDIEVAAITSAADRQIADIDSDIAEFEHRIGELRARKEEIAAGAGAAANARRTALEQRAADLRRQAEEQRRDLDQAGPGEVDTTEIVARIEAAQKTNAAVEARRRRETLEAEAAALERRSEALTTAMQEREQAKREAITGAKFPVPGLDFGDGEILFNGVPFEQASQAEKIRVSVGIAMAANPKLRVLCVRDGSLLDRDSLRLLSELVEQNDYQCWLEQTSDGDDGKVGILIEDGSVAAIRTIPEPAAQPEPAPAAQPQLAV